MKIEEILNEADEQGKPYFDEEEKKKFLTEWQELEENFPIFSTSTFQNEKDAEFQRLLSMIKSPIERQDVEKHAMRWAGQNGKPPSLYVQRYVREQNDVIRRNAGIEETHVLDLTKGKQLDESFLRQFGWLIQKVLERMFGSSNVPVKIKGSKEQIRALSRALASEKDYMVKFRDLGLDNPQTFRSKAKLGTAVDKFERATGIKWPFGDKK